MRPNRTKRLLDKGRPAFGSYAFLKDPASVEAMGYAGLDYAIIDTEHTALDMSHVEAMARGAEAAKITPIVRVYENNPKLILRALEAGAQGIMIPSVQSAEDARAAVRACRYPPEGSRGTCRMSRASRYGALMGRWSEHVQAANREILLVGLVEDEAGAGEIEAIVELMDVVVVGRGDLSTALGVSGLVDHPRVQEVVERAATTARRVGKPLGTLCYTSSDTTRWLREGYQFLQYSIDVQVLEGAYAAWVRDARDPAIASPAVLPTVGPAEG